LHCALKYQCDTGFLWRGINQDFFAHFGCAMSINALVKRTMPFIAVPSLGIAKQTSDHETVPETALGRYAKSRFNVCCYIAIGKVLARLKVKYPNTSLLQ
jgi:hypothetical protein